METMQWDKTYSVGIAEIDRLQQNYVMLLNKLIELRNEGAEIKDISDALADIVEFVRHYCNTEEKMLLRHHYPELGLHKLEHKLLLKNSMKFRRWFADDPDSLSDDVVNFFKEWGDAHFTVSDFRYGAFVRLQEFLGRYSQIDRRIRPV